ncbi:MAG: accessory Sec system translocase SecA2 [Clostridiales bacterium]|nr:accessory Sec system translocase SecA2 [Clostridiales bacterium]
MVNLKNIEYDLRPLKRILERIKGYDFSACSDEVLRDMSKRLRERAMTGADEKELLPEAFALVYEAVKRTLGLTPHDNQLLAAAAMTDGSVIELATGEGKTLAAVFTAYLKALPGKGVHVLTFNDYLAKRDALWMGPVYGLLGIADGFINERTDKAGRRLAYNADISYLTAKEAGFDYLRGFLCFEPAELVQRPYHFAVIDEADSILIDEARIPLVIAGDVPAHTEVGRKLYKAVSSMREGVHFSTDENGNAIYLEEEGIAFIEKQLRLDNLYDDRNLSILEKANLILQAEHLLKKDVDYIVKNGEILLVDEFTGRIAVNRQWSEGLHSAVEIKEGLTPKAQGKVINSITLQNFLRLYPDFCGMTGTACPAAAELLRFYQKSVTVIPPHRPCIRIDHPDIIFTHKEAKYAAVAAEIREAYKKGRPVLLGTCSIEESEHFVDMLRVDIPDIAVLNAKNDEAEADIIADAGRIGAVTISTNMAGRGVDIKLGGKDSEGYDKVRALGGLYIIGTNRHESIRVDNQLRGRAGRQGDPGESRFFLSLEDDLVVQYGLAESLPVKYKGLKQAEPLTNSAFGKAIIHTQKVVEGQRFDAKVTLFKYAAIVEDQRRIVYRRRGKILLGGETLSVLEKENPERYTELLFLVGEDEFRRAERMIEMYALNKCWADHLLFLDSLQDEVQMIGKVNGDPLTHYNKSLIDGFIKLEENIRATILCIYDSVIVRNGRIDLDEMGIKGPTSTRTYMVHDGTENRPPFGAVGELAATSAFTAVLYMFYAFMQWLEKRKEKSP